MNNYKIFFLYINIFEWWIIAERERINYIVMRNFNNNNNNNNINNLNII